MRYINSLLLTYLLTYLLAKKEINRQPTATHCTISLTSANWIMKYDLQLKCMLVRCERPIPGNRLIVLMLSN